MRSIAEYYLDELDNWRESIGFHLEATEEFHELLEEVLTRDTLTGLAARVEHFLSALYVSRQKLFDLDQEIHQFSRKLIHNEVPVNNDQVEPGLKKDLDALRETMLTTEKAFLELKYQCRLFLSETISSQDRKSRH